MMTKILRMEPMRKATYKGGHLPLPPGTVCNIRLVWDDDCEYVYVYVLTLGGNIKCIYDGKIEMEREWKINE